MGSWTLDVASGLIERSARHDEIFGYVERQPCWPLDLLLHHVEPRERGAVSAAFRDALVSGALDLEIPITGADGTARWVNKRGASATARAGARFA